MKPFSQSVSQELLVYQSESTEGLPVEIVLRDGIFINFPLKFPPFFHKFETKQGKLREKCRVAHKFRVDLFHLILLG
jgi:hypothetical protein